MAKKVAVVLSGCGVFDGAEIHESVISILALDRAGAEIVFCAPDREQMHVVNHHSGEVADGETRNVRVESARIARGRIKALDRIKLGRPRTVKAFAGTQRMTAEHTHSCEA